MPLRRHKETASLVFLFVLIVLPLAVLAVVGFVFIRKDKSLVYQEATERGQGIADQALRTVWEQINYVSGEGCQMEVSQSGELLFPPPLQNPLQMRRYDTSRLTKEQANLWTDIQRNEGGSMPTAEIAKKYDELLGMHPVQPFTALATYGLAAALERQDLPRAKHLFDEVARTADGVVTETGMRLKTLAEVKSCLLEMQRSSPRGEGATPHREMAAHGNEDTNELSALENVCSSIVYGPSLISEVELELLERAALGSATRATVEKWKSIWNSEMIVRRLYRSAITNNTTFTSDAAFGRAVLSASDVNGSSHLDETKWVAVRVDFEPGHLVAEYFPGTSNLVHATTFFRQEGMREVAQKGRRPNERWITTTKDHRFVWHRESELGHMLAAATPPTMPDYLALSLEILDKPVDAGRPPLRTWRLYHYGGKGGGIRKEATDEPPAKILAAASSPLIGDGQLKVFAYLISPSALMARQQARTFWLGSLILIATVSSIIGLFFAWRSFARQQRLAELKSNFVSSVSHELRAPIASVRLLAENLESGKVANDEKMHSYFRFIGQECRRLSALIENVLDFSRIDQNRKQYDFQPADVLGLTTQTVSLMIPYAQEKGVALVFDEMRASESNAFEAEVDAQCVQQALVNLIDNALKHSPRGQTVHVGIERASEGAGNVVNLWVEDQGLGIPESEHDRIFDRFYRLGSELRRETQGVGIGLSIVKHIVDAHHGRVLLRSSPGQGSRFTIQLPESQKGFDRDE
jgi:signal transduction histidine kinase